MLLIGKKDALPIAYAHIFNNGKFLTFSNENGVFTIRDDVNEIEISHLLYQTMNLKIKSLNGQKTILLDEKNQDLATVFIRAKKRKKILPKKSKTDFLFKKDDIRFPYKFIESYA